MILELLRWWYGPGLLQTMHRIGAWTAGVEHVFSISLLVRTLFSPWRRIITPGGKSLDARIRASLDNFVSRCVGFVIRSAVLVSAAIGMVCTFTAGVIMLVVWPLLPPAIIVFAVLGVIG